jgi:hypothetical protein
MGAETAPLLDYTVYALADLVGAVKTRLIELDVEIKTISPADRASAIARQRTFDEETERRLSNSAQDFLDAQELLFSAIREEAALIAQQSGWPVAVGEGALIGGFVVSAEGQGLQIVPQNPYANQAREACLWIREYDKNLTVAQLGMRYIMTEGLDILRPRSCRFVGCLNLSGAGSWRGACIRRRARRGPSWGYYSTASSGPLGEPRGTAVAAGN